jgi:hypothetical protein
MSVGLSYHLSVHQPKGLLIGWPLRSSSLASGHLCGSQFWLATRRSFPVDNHDIRMKIKIEDRINKKDYHILGHKHFFSDDAHALFDGWALSSAEVSVLAA